MTGQIGPFEYVSILVSIILGLGIAQLLSALADLLYHYHKVKSYWPHTIWVLFILFLHIQDWFITYQLKEISEWSVIKLSFVLLYPILLFLGAKMLLPTNPTEETGDMKLFYYGQYRIIFTIMSASITLSIFFNVYLLNRSWLEQGILFLFLGSVLIIVVRSSTAEIWHKILSMAILVATILATVIERDYWVIK